MQGTSAGHRGHMAASAAGHSLATLWLVGWIVVAGWMAVGTLASHQLRERLAGIPTGAAPPASAAAASAAAASGQGASAGAAAAERYADLRKLVRLLDELDAHEADIRGKRASVGALEAELVRLAAVEARSLTRAGSAKARLDGCREGEVAQGPAARTLPHGNGDGGASGPLGVALARQKAPEGATTGCDSLGVEHQGFLEEAAAAGADAAGAERQVLALREQIDAAKRQLEQVDLPGSADLVQLAQETQIVRVLALDWLFYLPASIVTLLLTLTMGALGSVLYLCREYVNGATLRSNALWVIQPLIGAITALAVYILAKAGQIAFVGDQGREAPLNPFTISLCAIFAGLVADQAYAAMIERARNLFAPRGGGAPHRPGEGGDGSLLIAPAGPAVVPQPPASATP